MAMYTMIFAIGAERCILLSICLGTKSSVARKSPRSATSVRVASTSSRAACVCGVAESCVIVTCTDRGYADCLRISRPIPCVCNVEHTAMDHEVTPQPPHDGRCAARQGLLHCFRGCRTRTTVNSSDIRESTICRMSGRTRSSCVSGIHRGGTMIDERGVSALAWSIAESFWNSSSSCRYMRRKLSTRVIASVVALALPLRGVVAQSASTGPTGGVRSISDAIGRRGADGDVTIGGRAVVASGKLQSGAFDVAIEDGMAGIRLFSRTLQIDVKEGDSVVATGRMRSYRGNSELAVTTVRVVASARRTILPHPLSIDAPALAQHAGQLVQVHGRVSGFGRSEGGQWLLLRDASSSARGSVTVWVPANHGAPIDLSTVRAQDSLIVTGVVTSYQDNTNDPVVWQIIPRDAADVRVTAVQRVIPEWALWPALVGALLLGTVLIISRVGARRQLHALRETEARYRQLLALLPDAVVVHSRGTILFANPAAAELFGFPSEQALVGRPLIDFVHPESRSAFAEHGAGSTLVPSHRAPRVRARMLGATGTVVDVEVASSPCVYHDTPAMVLLAHDITSQLRYERDLHALALVDDLTGLQNRRAFSLFAEQELARARRHGRTPVVVFADLDGLKQINDQYGHAAGDAAIRLVANALRSIFRETDIVARWSGDEFVALMVDGSEEASQLIASRLDAAITVQSPAGLPYVVTASVGASPLDPALPLRDAMERADAQLYTQKKRGRRSKLRTTPMGVHVIPDST